MGRFGRAGWIHLLSFICDGDDNLERSGEDDSKDFKDWTDYGKANTNSEVVEDWLDKSCMIISHYELFLNGSFLRFMAAHMASNLAWSKYTAAPIIAFKICSKLPVNPTMVAYVTTMFAVKVGEDSHHYQSKRRHARKMKMRPIHRDSSTQFAKFWKNTRNLWRLWSRWLASEWVGPFE